VVRQTPPGRNVSDATVAYGSIARNANSATPCHTRLLKDTAGDLDTALEYPGDFRSWH